MENFDWKLHPKTDRFLRKNLDSFLESHSFLRELNSRLYEETSTMLFDWVEYFVLGYSETVQDELIGLGFSLEEEQKNYFLYQHTGAHFPRIVLSKLQEKGLALKVEAIADFLMVHGLSRTVEGSLLSPFRRCHIAKENEINLWVTERRSTRSIEPVQISDEETVQILQAQETWRSRPRSHEDESYAFDEALRISQELVEALGENMTAWVILGAERAYWQSRNRAGQIQKSRQDRLGMGWANHDHHTFRSSRTFFSKLVQLFKGIGFHCRESFYAGEEAGWGAQVMENSISGFVLFLDVDLLATEVDLDFAHQPLRDLKDLGTVGLWCGLHGDSILNAGMHHLESQFIFQKLTADLKCKNVNMMQPFSDFDYLKQAFTEGEIWPVSGKRLERLFEKGYITKEQASSFRDSGAVGSHLENLQRCDGYKGFNKSNVSFIIKKTDPRNYPMS
jgi:hypothetical protein